VYIRRSEPLVHMDAYKFELREIAERINKIIECVDADCNPGWVEEEEFSSMVKRMVVSIFTRIHTFETMILYFRFEFEHFNRSALSHGIDLKVKFDQQIKTHGGICSFEKFEKKKTYAKFLGTILPHPPSAQRTRVLPGCNDARKVESVAAVCEGEPGAAAVGFQPNFQADGTLVGCACLGRDCAGGLWGYELLLG
jgi:hypothetical protein